MSNFSEGISRGLGVGSSLEAFLSGPSVLYIRSYLTGGKSFSAEIASIVASLIGFYLSNLLSLRASTKWSLNGAKVGGKIAATV